MSILSVSCWSRPVRVVAATLCAGTVVAGAAGCGDGGDKQRPLTDLVLNVEQIPDGYTVVPASVDDLIASNRSTLDQAASVTFSPDECTPTADAAFNPQLNDANTVLIVASSDAGTLSETISSVVRDVDADRRATTGVCRVVTAEPTKGTLAGSHIVTTTTELPGPTGDAVENELVVRSDSVTTLPDQGVRVRSALLSNVVVRRKDGSKVTVQLNLATVDQGVLKQVPADFQPPMSDGSFVQLVQNAVDRAAS
ncbi:MAG: hypothetical protein QM774_12565 [Gordonia sp. (in: high G+C Gram-positive bacteria)]|uniref:hypothetical protein n=1 Tax=Gordonia sp. (in: high G+C Gram-positive bacteria) TaxID=84139 RepID=UPI0039E54510